MKERIQKLLDSLRQKFYDNEIAHAEYDSILEEYIKNINEYGQDEYLLICELIDIEKEFWYA